MYKVFINERPIILTDSLFVESDFDLLNYKNTIISEIIHNLTEGSTKGIILLCADLQEACGDFKSLFNVISASGGLVINKQLEFLFIFRGGKW
ncbi:MAG: NUDIX hydrolase, partial [Flavobacterium sp.]|nr:NUDIX hydrolase [Flavobacterium sp.]